MALKTFVVRFTTSAGLERSIRLEAATVDAALAKWDRIRQPGDFADHIGPAFSIDSSSPQWQNH